MWSQIISKIYPNFAFLFADPWGFPEKPADLSQRYPIPLWVKMIAYCLQPLNPLWGIRIAGPMGKMLYYNNYFYDGCKIRNK